MAMPDDHSIAESGHWQGITTSRKREQWTTD
jgi:hypothetical protein